MEQQNIFIIEHKIKMGNYNIYEITDSTEATCLIK